MSFELIKDVAKLVLIVACLYLAFTAYARRKQTGWSDSLMKRRVAILLLLIFAVSAIKVSEDALEGESGPIDEAILRSIHSQVPNALTGFFEAVTFTGSAKVLFPLATATTVALLWARRRFEAGLFLVSVSTAAALFMSLKRSLAEHGLGYGIRRGIGVPAFRVDILLLSPLSLPLPCCA